MAKSAPEENRYRSWEEIAAMAALDDDPIDAARREATPAATPASNVLPDDYFDRPDKFAGEQELVRLFAALGSDVRLEIIMLLLVGPARAKDIALELEQIPSRLSRHLAILEQAGVVQVEPHRTAKIYSLTSSVEPLLEAASQLKKAPGGASPDRRPI